MEDKNRKHKHGEHECRCHAVVKINTQGFKEKTEIKGADTQEGKTLEGERDQGEEDRRHCSHEIEDGHNHCHSSHGHSHHGHFHGQGHKDHHHNHSHGHHHHGHSHSLESLDSLNRVFYIGIALNLIFTFIEFIVGYSINSLALLADASHNLSDVASLLISLIGLKLAQKAANSLYTYGYKKASILASLINAIILVFIAGNISIEAVKRMGNAPDLIGTPIIITALIGVGINAVSAFLFFKGQKQDINVKGAFLHLMADAVVSLGVVLSGVIIHYTGLDIIDPIISIIIAIVVLMTTWGLLKESIKLTLDGVPQNVDSDKVREILLEDENIASFHDLHIWAIGSSQNALTVHVTLKGDMNLDDFIEIKYNIKRELEGVNIQHATIEIGKTDKCEYSC